MQKEVILITGANGEIGHGLIDFFGKGCKYPIVALDLQQLDETLKSHCHEFILGNILDEELFRQLGEKYQIKTIYHLASLLSTHAEREPELAHDVNVNGTINLLKLAWSQGEKFGVPVKFIYPSSIAAYGLPGVETKTKSGKIKENEWLYPTTMYGCNKLYCEHLGRYYSNYYGQLKTGGARKLIDFRALRFPGLISPITVPTGGTTDYGPEMLHHAAQNLPYTCFVREDTRLPFMVMSDAIKSMIQLEASPKESLSQIVYNVSSFSPTAQEFSELVLQAYPQAQISFSPDYNRQKFVDTWPAEIDDSAARTDWGWHPEYDQEAAFKDILVPAVNKRYGLGLDSA
ncbi:MAG: NAD-dependent epimerase/dehydratase family protein [Anaerolineaceae bacterium]|nr:NAD-dependent epimerase/dehydratase family protein [Anaerolineaceae bacterium]